MNKIAHGLPEDQIQPALLELAVSRTKSVVGSLFSRRASQEKYPVGSPAWAAYHSARLRNPVVKDITDIEPWIYYDRFTAAQGSNPAQNILYFQTPMGQSGKTKLDTNMKQPGQLGGMKHMLVMALRFIFNNMFVPDIELFNISYWIEFEVVDKIYAEGHFVHFPGGAGVYGNVSGALTSPGVASFGGNGTPDPYATNNWGMDRAVHILQGQNFKVSANAPAAITLAASSAAVGGFQQQGRGANITANLDGILYREVQ